MINPANNLVQIELVSETETEVSEIVANKDEQITELQVKIKQLELANQQKNQDLETKDKQLQTIKKKNSEHYQWIKQAIWDKVSKKKSETIDKYAKTDSFGKLTVPITKDLDELMKFYKEYLDCLQEEKEFNELTK